MNHRTGPRLPAGDPMPSSKKPKASSKKPARAAPKAAKKPARPAAKARRAPVKQKTKRAPAKPAAPRPAAKGNPMAAKMAAFSKQVLDEEEAPVAVRTFNEARAGIEESKKLDVRTGTVSPAVVDEDADEEVDDETPVPPARPQMEPLTGPLAVPKRKESEEFQIAPSAKPGKKGKLPTRDDLGKIELRMQRGTSDKTVANASPDYLQRSFNKAAQSGKVAATGGPSDVHHEPERFDVAMDKPRKGVDASLADFGDVEIAQQTRKGKRTLGKLDADDEARDERTQ